MKWGMIKTTLITLWFTICLIISTTSLAAKFSIVVIPDTQWFAENEPDIMEAQAQWVVDNRIKENIIYVAHLGDLKDDQTCDNDFTGDGSGRTEWEVVEDMYDILEDPATTNLPFGIPYGVVPGNHDFDPIANDCPNYDDERPLVEFNNLFGPGEFAGFSYYGGSMDAGNNENNYTLFEYCGIEFIAINLTYHPNAAPIGNPDTDVDPIVAWADGLLAANPGRIGIVTSHFILNEQSPPTPVSFGSYGARLYDGLAGNPNLFMMLGAHRRGEAWRVESRIGMDDVHIILANYQDIRYLPPFDFTALTSSEPGDAGFMRIMRFDTDTNQISVETFAPAVPSLGRLSDVVSDNDVLDGSLMSRFTASNFTIPFTSPAINPSVAILMDTSGSMTWGVDGTTGVPADQQRITYAKESAKSFLDMMIAVPANEDQASFGIAAFPNHIGISCAAATGQVVTSMISANSTNINAATGPGGTIDTDPDLAPEGWTPLISGVETAQSMFDGSNQCRSIILLSDGYHNCPTPVDFDDPIVDTLVSDLNTDEIRVFTVGFGEPGDTDNLLHQRLADDTTPDGASSQFYDVTDDLGYNPALPSTWDDIAKPALDSAFKEILSSVLGLETAVDPIDTIKAGEVKSYEVPINEHDRKIGFYISWRTLQKNRLTLTVYDSNNNIVSPVAAGVKQLSTNTYHILSVDKSYLTTAGAVGPQPWRIEIRFGNKTDIRRVASGKLSGEEIFQYSVIMDSTFKLHPLTGNNDAAAGDTLTLTAQLTEAGKPVLGLSDVHVIISAPEDGQGNWLSTNLVTREQLAQVPQNKDSEPLTPVQLKAVYLTDFAKINFPAKRGPKKLPLYDDGTHGDITPKDGIYTNRYSDTDKEGIYSFYFQSTGGTQGGNHFSREQLLQRYLPVRPAAKAFEFAISALPVTKIKPFDITFTPKDTLGNFVGPGHAGRITFRAEGGRFTGNISDNLDGSYTQRLITHRNANEKEIQIIVSIDDIRHEFRLCDEFSNCWLSKLLGQVFFRP